MFDNLGERLGRTVKNLRGEGRLTEDNIRETLREVRMALLEADVALPVVRDFIEQVRERALGAEVARSVTPGQALIKIVHDELVRILGESEADLNLRARPPAVILLAGLQGSGKTTSAGKLARRLAERDGKSVLLASCDLQRPAAVDQLARLAEETGAGFCAPREDDTDPAVTAGRAVEEARRRFADVVIIDTAGRMHVDADMMAEARAIHSAVGPVETLFVVDSMTGQDAANTARAFDESLALTGVLLTKADGDARGGAALSIRQITGKPIKLVGVSEKLDGLEAFDPARMADRILGKGDVVGLVEEAERKVDQDKAEALADKLKKGKSFDLADYRDQLEQMQQLGGIGGLLDKLPGMGTGAQQALEGQMDDRSVRRQVAMVNAMTPWERRHPDRIKASRKRRIAAGSGTRVQDVNRLLKQHGQMQRMMKQMGKGGMNRMLQSLGGRMPPGM